jgi:hypothetical protein
MIMRPPSRSKRIQHTRRLRARGTAMVEAVIVLPVFVVLWFTCLFAFNVSANKIAVNNTSRSAAWGYAMANCSRSGDPAVTTWPTGTIANGGAQSDLMTMPPAGQMLSSGIAGTTTSLTGTTAGIGTLINGVGSAAGGSGGPSVGSIVSSAGGLTGSAGGATNGSAFLPAIMGVVGSVGSVLAKFLGPFGANLIDSDVEQKVANFHVAAVGKVETGTSSSHQTKYTTSVFCNEPPTNGSMTGVGNEVKNLVHLF